MIETCHLAICSTGSRHSIAREELVPCTGTYDLRGAPSYSSSYPGSLLSRCCAPACYQPEGMSWTWYSAAYTPL